MQLSTDEIRFLRRVSVMPRFPLVRYELRSSRERSLSSIALNHVFLKRPTDTMEQVKERAAVIQGLEEKGLVSLDYHLFVTVRSDYRVYEESRIFSELCDLVMEAKYRPGYLFDTAYVKRGMATLTPAGRAVLERLLEQR